MKNDLLIKIFPEKFYCEIETSKDKVAKINFSKFTISKKYFLDVNFFKLDKDEFIRNISYIEDLPN